MLQGVMIGFENSRKVALESDGEIQLCVKVLSASIGSDFEAFSLQVETSDYSASTYQQSPCFIMKKQGLKMSLAILCYFICLLFSYRTRK